MAATTDAVVLLGGAGTYLERLRAFRNRPGGFWVAGTGPEAAAEAVTGSVLRGDVRATALLSDEEFLYGI